METNLEYIHEPSVTSQNGMILALLRDGKSITPLEALNMFGCMRLASRISDIKRMLDPMKENIVTEKVKLANNKMVSRYTLIKT